jgi:hypothetical protein
VDAGAGYAAASFFMASNINFLVHGTPRRYPQLQEVAAHGQEGAMIGSHRRSS